MDHDLENDLVWLTFLEFVLASAVHGARLLTHVVICLPTTDEVAELFSLWLRITILTRALRHVIAEDVGVRLHLRARNAIKEALTSVVLSAEQVLARGCAHQITLLEIERQCLIRLHFSESWLAARFE